ncbi:MAG TPA: cation-transporting P-type ATPase [Anaerolineales bacterium]|nr:cation-transporting P-type ATPase [Anaerolineales bacterium]
MADPLYKHRPADVYTALETSPQGLASGEVSTRRELYGENRLSTPPPPSHGIKFAQHVFHPLSLILWLAGVVALLASEPVLAGVIWMLILINAGFTYWREYRAEQAIFALHQILPAYARLIRDGQEVQIPASAVVPGDVLILAEGDNIPADARVVEAFGLRTNNSVLTGETMPAPKTADASVRDGLSDLERPNLIFAGTSVISGTGRAVVFATGMLTQIGRIAHLTQTAKEEPTPLQLELKRMTRQIFVAALGISVVVFAVGFFDLNMDVRDAFLLALGIMVAAVPEGLPATITLTMALAGQRLAQRGVLVKQLTVMETLGTVSTLCTDKSGTLTQNQLTVREVWVSGQRLRVSGVGYDPQGTFTPAQSGTYSPEDLRALLTAAALCNNSRLIPPTPGRPQWSSLGDQTEAALKVLALKGGLDDATLFAEYPRVHELPFDARRKRMGTIHRYRLNGKTGPLSMPAPEIAFVKGAPREVLQLCTRVLINGQVKLLDEKIRMDVLAANDEYARNALRVLAITRRELPSQTQSKTPERIERDLTLLGLVAMQDPPRPEVAEAMKICRQAGIRLVMVTGDYGLTAESFARRVGMLATPNPRIVTGAEVDGLSDEEFQALLVEEVIFARMAPEHKLRLVAAFQARGEVVAVTGDGVNDAPALRKADVGIVMGLTGTDVAKEAADVILMNDNFANFVSAVEEGRAVYDNLRKFITYILASNVPEILPFMVTAWFPQIPLALTVKQILAIDLGTDMFPALGLGSEKPEPDIMQRPPRPRGKPLVDRALLSRAFLWLGLIEAVLCYTGFFLMYALWQNGGQLGSLQISLLGFAPGAYNISAEQAYYLAVTVFHAGVVLAQIGNVFACRTETNRGRRLGWFSNRLIWIGVLAEVGLIVAMIYFPFLAHEFDHLPIPLIFWAWLGLYAPILYSLDWIRKGVVRWLKKRKHLVQMQEVV